MSSHEEVNPFLRDMHRLSDVTVPMFVGSPVQTPGSGVVTLKPHTLNMDSPSSLSKGHENGVSCQGDGDGPSLPQGYHTAG